MHLKLCYQLVYLQYLDLIDKNNTALTNFDTIITIMEALDNNSDEYTNQMWMTELEYLFTTVIAAIKA